MCLYQFVLTERNLKQVLIDPPEAAGWVQSDRMEFALFTNKQAALLNTCNFVLNIISPPSSNVILGYFG